MATSSAVHDEPGLLPEDSPALQSRREADEGDAHVSCLAGGSSGCDLPVIGCLAAPSCCVLAAHDQPSPITTLPDVAR